MSATVLNMLEKCIYFSDSCEDYELVKESHNCGQIVMQAKEKYQRNTFGHGLVLLKMSLIDRLLKTSKYETMRKEAQQILCKCLGQEQSTLLMDHYYQNKNG